MVRTQPFTFACNWADAQPQALFFLPESRKALIFYPVTPFLTPEVNSVLKSLEPVEFSILSGRSHA
jgi:hypothetical protein